jgi:hypothetical protein
MQQQQQAGHARSAHIGADNDHDHTYNEVQQHQRTASAEETSAQSPVQHNTARAITNVLQQQQQQQQQQFTQQGSAADSYEYANDHLPQLQVQALAVDTPIDSAAVAAGTSASFKCAVADAACSEDIELLRANFKALLGVVCREVRGALYCYRIYHVILQVSTLMIDFMEHLSYTMQKQQCLEVCYVA